MKLFLIVALACTVVDAQSVQPSRELTIQEAHSILEAALPDATKRLPGFELEDSAGYSPTQFYFVEVIWDNPGGSVVYGNYAVDRATGDLWDAVMECQRITSKRIRAVQRQIRERIGLSDPMYQRIKRPGPMCQ